MTEHPDSNGRRPMMLGHPGALEPWAQMEAESHKPDGAGGCTCGFCVWSVEHVVIMSIRDAWPKAWGQPTRQSGVGMTVQPSSNGSASITEDLCHANAGAGDCYWPTWPEPGSVPMYFKCLDRITEPVIEFPCSGSKHLPGGVQVICSCECHTKPQTALAVGYYVPMSVNPRPLAWRTWPDDA